MRVTKTTHPELWELNPQWGLYTHLLGFEVNEETYQKFRKEADRIYSHLNPRQKDIVSLHSALQHPGAHGQASPEKAAEVSRPVDTHHTRLLVAILIVVFLLLVWAVRSHAEPAPELNDHVLASLKIFPPNLFPQGVGVVNPSQFIFDASNNLKVNCILGCSATAGFTDNSAFTVGGSTINVMGAYFTSGADPSCTTGNGCRLRADASSNLKVNCAVGCAGGSTTPSDAFANPTTAGLQFSFLAGWNGATWDRLKVDGSKNLDVNCAVGCSAGSLTNNNAAPIANNSGVLPAVANAANPTLVEGNQVLESLDLAGNQRVKVNAALPAGSNVIGHVIADSGSTTAVTGNVTVVQPTGTSLHAVLDTTSTTAATQATGTNLHTVTDATSVTAATLSAETTKVIGTVREVGNVGGVLDAIGQNVAAPANWWQGGCQFNTSPTTITSTNGSPTQCDNAGNALVDLKTALPAGANVIGHTINDSGSTTAVTGNVTVVQPTGTSLHAVLDTTSTTAVTQATAANLNATIVGTKTNNNAAPGATNVGDLPAIANAATQTWTEGDQVSESVDLSGRQRIVGTAGDNAGAATTNRTPTLPAIAQTSYRNGTADTQGRDASLDVGTDGLLWTAQLPAIRPASYHWSASFAGSSTTVAAHITGNASGTLLLVTKIAFSCTQTTAGNVTVTVNKTSAASTGGTAATITAVPDDSNYSAASSVAQSFTGTGPTAGTPVGQIDAYKLGCMAAATATPNDIYILNLRQKPIVLRGVAQTLEIGVGAATTGGNYTVTFEGIETATITP